MKEQYRQIKATRYRQIKTKLGQRHDALNLTLFVWADWMCGRGHRVVNVCTLGCGKQSLIKVTKCNAEYFKVHGHAYNSRFCQQERSRRETVRWDRWSDHKHYSKLQNTMQMRFLIKKSYRTTKMLAGLVWGFVKVNINMRFSGENSCSTAMF